MMQYHVEQMGLAKSRPHEESSRLGPRKKRASFFLRFKLLEGPGEINPSSLHLLEGAGGDLSFRSTACNAFSTLQASHTAETICGLQKLLSSSGAVGGTSPTEVVTGLNPPW